MINENQTKQLFGTINTFFDSEGVTDRIKAQNELILSFVEESTRTKMKPTHIINTVHSALDQIALIASLHEQYSEMKLSCDISELTKDL